MKKLFFLFIATLFLTNCSLPTRKERNPADPGFGRDDLKKSKCACIPIYKGGKWL